MLAKWCTSFALAAVLIAGFEGNVWSADIYVVDGAHTRVDFTVTHLLISRVTGTFDDFRGTIIYDANDITKSSLSGTINVASIDTANRKRDTHLRGEDFFDAANHPQITFETTRVEAGDGAPVLHGVLTMRGVSKEVAIPFRITRIADSAGETRLRFEARLKLNRQDYGISHSRLIRNEVSVELDGEAMKTTEN